MDTQSVVIRSSFIEGEFLVLIFFLIVLHRFIAKVKSRLVNGFVPIF